MAKRTGTNKGSSALRGSKREYLRYVLSPKGSAANFSQDDDKSATVVADNDFPPGDHCVWRLQSAPDQAGTRLTATDDAGNFISGYDRVVKPRGSPKTGQSGSPENRPVVAHHPGH
jgi:hypothetical protein